jgi:hypothetical protein
MIADPPPAVSVVATPSIGSPTTTRTVRLALGHTRDVSMMEGEVEVLEIDAAPRAEAPTEVAKAARRNRLETR